MRSGAQRAHNIRDDLVDARRKPSGVEFGRRGLKQSVRKRFGSLAQEVHNRRILRQLR